MGLRILVELSSVSTNAYQAAEHVPPLLLQDPPVLKKDADSAITRHLKASKACIPKEQPAKQFQILAVARNSEQLNVLEALLFKKVAPPLCNQKEHYKNCSFFNMSLQQHYLTNFHSVVPFRPVSLALVIASLLSSFVCQLLPLISPVFLLLVLSSCVYPNPRSMLLKSFGRKVPRAFSVCPVSIVIMTVSTIRLWVTIYQFVSTRNLFICHAQATKLRETYW